MIELADIVAKHGVTPTFVQPSIKFAHGFDELYP
jgi:hypothetical protein